MDKPERLGEQTARSPQNGLFRTCMNAFVPARTNGVVTCASQRSGTVDTVKQVYSDKPTMGQARCHTDRQIPACMPHLTRITASPVVHCLLPRPVATPPAAPPANPPAAPPCCSNCRFLPAVPEHIRTHSSPCPPRQCTDKAPRTGKAGRPGKQDSTFRPPCTTGHQSTHQKNNNVALG